MSKITFETWSEATVEALWDLAKMQGLDHVDELAPADSLYIQMRMAEEWINYKARCGELILA